MGVQNLSGEVLGQYELREILGTGGMGAVYRGYQTNLKRIVAIKVLPETFAEQPGYIERFNREAMTAASMEHPHIVPVYDYGTQRNISYVVMRLLTGGSLSERLLQRLGSQQPLPSLGEVTELLKQLASALDYAHSQGIIHRDIKPGNVMFDNQGASYLVDFGIAKLLGATSVLTGTGMTMGTPAYMAPEQWRAEEITPATDQYALGVMTYQLVTGHLPFEAPTPFSLMHKAINEDATPPHIWRPDTPLVVALVLSRAMAKSPGDRFPTTTAFAQAFDGAVQGLEGGSTNIFTYPLRPKTLAMSSASKPVIQAADEPPAPPKEPTAPPPTVPPVSPAPVPLQRNPLAWAAVIALLLLGAAAVIFASRSDGGASVQQTAVQQTLVAINVTQTAQSAQLPIAAATSTSSSTATVAASATTQPSATSTVLPPTVTASLTNTVAASATNTSIPPSSTSLPTDTTVPTTTNTAVPPSLTPLPTDTTVPSETSTSIPPSLTSLPTDTTIPASSTLTAATNLAAAAVAATMPPTEEATLAPGTVRTDKTGISQVWVPAGCFQMGSDPKLDPYAQTNEQPAHQVCLTQGYWIDEYEVTNDAYQPFFKAGGYSNRSYWPDDQGWTWSQSPTGGAKAPANWDGYTYPTQPRVGVSWYEANAYALWRGCSLPTEAQWEYAARGPQSLIYPWGNAYTPGKSNVNGQRTKNVGTVTDDKSWVGAFDMAGNVWEWTSDWYNKSYYATASKDDPTGPTSGERHTLRGGTWNFGPEVARSATRNANFASDYRDNDIGFRLVCSQ